MRGWRRHGAFSSMKGDFAGARENSCCTFWPMYAQKCTDNVWVFLFTKHYYRQTFDCLYFSVLVEHWTPKAPRAFAFHLPLMRIHLHILRSQILVRFLWQAWNLRKPKPNLCPFCLLSQSLPDPLVQCFAPYLGRMMSSSSLICVRCTAILCTLSSACSGSCNYDP